MWPWLELLLCTTETWLSPALKIGSSFYALQPKQYNALKGLRPDGQINNKFCTQTRRTFCCY